MLDNRVMEKHTDLAIEVRESFRKIPWRLMGYAWKSILWLVENFW